MRYNDNEFFNNVHMYILEDPRKCNACGLKLIFYTPGWAAIPDEVIRDQARHDRSRGGS